MAAGIDSVYRSVVASLGYNNLKNGQYAIISNFALGSDAY